MIRDAISHPRFVLVTILFEISIDLLFLHF